MVDYNRMGLSCVDKKSYNLKFNLALTKNYKLMKGVSLIC